MTNSEDDTSVLDRAKEDQASAAYSVSVSNPFILELKALIAKYSHTRDEGKILDYNFADYLENCLINFQLVTRAREKYYGIGFEEKSN